MTDDDAITEVAGITVGHWTDRRGATGCTVVLCGEDGAVGGVDARGGAPGTRETDLLRPGMLAERVHAVVLTGGSAYGLDAASGVMRFLEEHDIGMGYGGARVPLVPAAVIFDLSVGRATARPTADAGYRAAAAAKGARVAQGSVGAGTGATVAKAAGAERCLKGGVGTAAERGADGLIVGALAVVNAGGEVVDAERGRRIAAPRGDRPGAFLDTLALLRRGRPRGPGAGEQTTLAVVATNARLDKEGANRLASAGQDGVARAIRPAHGPLEGDVVFALSAGEIEVGGAMGQQRIEALAARAVERAIVRGVLRATSLAGVPSVEEWTARTKR